MRGAMREQRLAVRHQEIEYAELRDLARQLFQRREQFVQRRLAAGEFACADLAASAQNASSLSVVPTG